MALNTETSASMDFTNPLTGLGETEKRVLSYAAAMGKEFDFSVLETATEMDEEQLAEMLEKLVHRGILKELNWGDSYSFVQVVTLALAYRDISSSRLRLIHKKIAEASEKLHPDPTPDLIPEMGRHFHLGGVHEKSLLYNRYAAMLAKDAFSPDVAIHYLERAREDIAALPGDHRLEEADILKDIGEQFSALGDDSRADEFYGESLKKLPEEEVTMRALLLLARAGGAREMDNMGLSHQYCDQAIQLLEKVRHRKGLALAHQSLGRVAFKEGQFELGRKEMGAALELLDPEKDAKDCARCYIDLGNVHSMSAEPAEQARTLKYYRKAIQLLEPLHDYYELSRAHNNLSVDIGLSNPREALDELAKARHYAEKSGDKRFMGWVLFNTVYLLLPLGEEAEAARNCAEARRILSKYCDPSGMQQVTLSEGMLAQHRKSFEDAEKAYLDALKMSENLGYPPVVVEALMYLATMYADWGKNSEAIKAVSRIREIGEDNLMPMTIPSYQDLKKRLGVEQVP
jgi:tetratricopeptide (TPR) repeat protein